MFNSFRQRISVNLSAQIFKFSAFRSKFSLSFHDISFIHRYVFVSVCVIYCYHRWHTNRIQKVVYVYYNGVFIKKCSSKKTKRKKQTMSNYYVEFMLWIIGTEQYIFSIIIILYVSYSSMDAVAMTKTVATTIATMAATATATATTPTNQIKI